MRDSWRQLDVLLADPGVLRAVALTTRATMLRLNCSHVEAHQFVLSAIGEPDTVATIYRAWTAARDANGSLGLVKVIIRRRVIDLLRKNLRRPGHDSLPDSDDDIAADSAFGSHEGDLRCDPAAHAQRTEIAELVHRMIDGFAQLGDTQREQLDLLRKYACDEIDYDKLCEELKCSYAACRVRVFKARRALRRFIEKHCPELGDYAE